MLANTQLPLEEFIDRRAKMFAYMANNSIALFSAGNEATRSNDTDYVFCQNKNFYYLTGFNEPDAILVLLKADDKQQSILFCREKDTLQEVWHGRRWGAEKAQQNFGFSKAFTLAELDEKLPELLNGKSHAYFMQGESPSFEQQLHEYFQQLRSASRQNKKAPHAFIDCTHFIHDLRLFKSNTELRVMRQANVISGLAHQRAMRSTSAERFEYQIEAELLHEFAWHGARNPAYTSIVAGGDNANILHYTENSEPLDEGDLLLIDAGAEFAGYAADITRTFPVSGKFTPPQQALYQLVLNSQHAAIEAIKPGATLADLNIIANRVLTQGLIDLGILQGELEDLLAEKACKKYFIHGLGHWLGLDVHDVGDYGIDENRQQARPFEAGMVMTIEPGLYFPANDLSVEEKWRGIGIRIEDNVLVTETGFENLTVNAPKEIADIEQLMAKTHND